MFGKIGADKAATILGYGLAAGQAAQVALTQVQPGSSMHAQDWLSLATAVVFALFGKITNRGTAN